MPRLLLVRTVDSLSTDTSVNWTPILEWIPAFFYSIYLTLYKRDTSLRQTLRAHPATMTTPNQAAYFRYTVHNTKQCTYQQVPHHQHHCCFHCCHHHLLPHLPVHQREHPHLLLTDVILMNKQSCSFYEQARMEGSWLYFQVNINNNIFSSRWQFWQTNILYLKVTITKYIWSVKKQNS